MNMLRWFATGFCLASGILCCADSSAAPRFDYILGIGVEHNDNVNLSEDDPLSSNVVRPWFGFRLREDGATVQAMADGLVEYRDYSNWNFSNETRTTLNAFVNWTLIPERLDLVVVDYLAEQPINSLEANAPINLQRTNVFAIGPTLHFNLGSTMRGQAELRYIDSYAEETEAFNSRRNAAAFRLIKDFSPITQVSLNALADRINFKHEGDVPDYDRYAIYARFARKLRLLDFGLDFGYTWLDGSEPIGSRSKPLFRGSLDWHPSPTSTLSLRAAHQYNDTSSGMLEAVPMRSAANRQVPIPSSIVIGTNVISAEPYLEDQLELGYTWQAASMSWGVAPYLRRLDYLDSLSDAGFANLDQRAVGAGAFVNWLLRPNITLGAVVNAESLKYSDLDRTDRNNTYGLFLLHRWSSHWSWRADLSHYKRDSDAPGQSSKQNIVFVSVAYNR